MSRFPSFVLSLLFILWLVFNLHRLKLFANRFELDFKFRFQVSMEIGKTFESELLKCEMLSASPHPEMIVFSSFRLFLIWTRKEGKRIISGWGMTRKMFSHLCYFVSNAMQCRAINFIDNILCILYIKVGLTFFSST